MKTFFKIFSFVFTNFLAILSLLAIDSERFWINYHKIVNAFLQFDYVRMLFYLIPVCFFSFYLIIRFNAKIRNWLSDKVDVLKSDRKRFVDYFGLLVSLILSWCFYAEFNLYGLIVILCVFIFILLNECIFLWDRKTKAESMNNDLNATNIELVNNNNSLKQEIETQRDMFYSDCERCESKVLLRALIKGQKIQ